MLPYDMLHTCCSCDGLTLSVCALRSGFALGFAQSADATSCVCAQTHTNHSSNVPPASMGKAKVNKHNYHSEAVRAAAVQAYLQVGHGAPGALKTRFHELAPNHTVSDKHVPEFCKKWAERFQQTSSITSAPKPGRPKQLTDQQVKSVVGRIRNGRQVGGRWRPYASYTEAAKDDSVIRDILNNSGVTVETLKNRVEADAPGLVVPATVYIRAQLSGP